MRKRAATLVVFGLLAMTLALPAAADAPVRWVIETEQPGENPCTGDPILLQTEVLVSSHVHKNTTVTHGRLLGSIGEHETNLATLHIVENNKGLKATIREMHTAPDGSKFKVTIVNVVKVGTDPVFTFDARCVRAPRS